jgi:hypothetical protein
MAVIEEIVEEKQATPVGKFLSPYVIPIPLFTNISKKLSPRFPKKKQLNLIKMATYFLRVKNINPRN